MIAPRKRTPTERPTARKVVDELLGEERGAEVGAVLAGGLFEKMVDSMDAVKAEDGSAEASSLRSTLIKSRKHWNLASFMAKNSRQHTENN